MSVFQEFQMPRQGWGFFFVSLLHKQKDVMSAVDLIIFFLLSVFPQ